MKTPKPLVEVDGDYVRVGDWWFHKGIIKSYFEVRAWKEAQARDKNAMRAQVVCALLQRSSRPLRARSL